jgi:hypothetical protein
MRFIHGAKRDHIDEIGESYGVTREHIDAIRENLCATRNHIDEIGEVISFLFELHGSSVCIHNFFRCSL